MTTAAADAFSPIRVGTMSLGHRLVVPPHSGGGGALLGTEEQFDRMCRYWLARVQGGMQWVGGGPMFVRNPLIPGFEPTGIGSNADGFFRHPLFVERMGRYMDRLHEAGGFGTVQMVLQGGMPIAPSQTLSGYLDHAIPHRLDLDEIAWLVREYGESAALAAEAGADAIELHSNHDDVLQWFLSPRTNRRDDGYGGGTEGRRRLLREVCEAIRGRVGRPITLGLRLCLDEMIDGGYGIEECAAFVSAFTKDGTVDYFSFDVGNNWGTPSYVPIGLHPEGEWAGLAGRARAATHLPAVYVGRVVHPEVAEAILAAGQADLVGLARALIADPSYVEKMRTGRAALGDRIVVVSEDDRPAPLAVADQLAGAGHQVTLVYQSPAPSPQVGKYSIGSMLARLDSHGVRLVPMARAVGFTPGVVELSHSYSNRCWTLDGIDTVVLACGSVSDDTLYHELRQRHPAVHVLGDAYAPRRLSFATRQAYELVRSVLTGR